MLEQGRLDALDTFVTTGSTLSTRSTGRTCRVMTRRDVTSQVEFGLTRVKASATC